MRERPTFDAEAAKRAFREMGLTQLLEGVDAGQLEAATEAMGRLSLEERLINRAQAHGAPRLSRAEAARLLGAEETQLDATLHGRAADALGTITGSGLRLDQAAALFAVLTSDRRVDVIVGPGGNGKTTTAGTASQIWEKAGLGGVFGVAPSQAATNSLTAAGVPQAANAAKHLGHLPDRREALGARSIGPDALLAVDEGSMMSTPDVAALVNQAALMRACPKCGDIGFDFVNGCNDEAGMWCRLACEFKWPADGPPVAGAAVAYPLAGGLSGCTGCGGSATLGMASHSGMTHRASQSSKLRVPTSSNQYVSQLRAS
jgi:AAA domain